MIKTVTCIAILSILVSCKSETKKEADASPNASEVSKNLSAAQHIAEAHGIDQWKNVEEIDFTFNVDSEGNHFERSWQWHPKSNDVVMMTKKDTVRYNRASVDSLSLNADQAFINDKFWLLAPFQLVWDEGIEISQPVKEQSPIANEDVNKITLTYTGDKGYTPGDAYDFYYGDDYKIKEWVYRKGNSKEPSAITTYENYQDFNGIKIATDHIKKDSNWKLFFSDVKIKS